MFLDQFLANSEFYAAILAALSASFAVLVAFWPYFAPDPLERRMRQVVDEAERIRLRERARLGSNGVRLRVEPRKFFKDIVQRLNLAKYAEDGAMVRRLRMAGMRGEAPVTAFLAFRVLAPLAGFGLAAFYIVLVLQPDYPLFLQLAMAAIVGALFFYAPGIYVTNRIQKRQESITRAWPDALDLLLICVEAGMSIESALRRVATEVAAECAELAEELALATAEMAYLADRRKAFENLAARTGVESVRAAATTLIQADRHGTSLGQSLRVLAQEGRAMRMNAAEKKAAALPPKLTVPMIVFFLPVLFAVILGPAIIQIFNMP